MNSEKQYIDLYGDARQVIFDHSTDVLNAVRDRAFDDFKAQGFPNRKVERYKYTDMQKLFEPDYGLNLKRVEFPLNPYDAFKCDVPSKEWKLREDLEDKLKEEGWDVRKIKIDNGCYEVYGFDKKGRKREAYFNPKTFELVGDVQQ